MDDTMHLARTGWRQEETDLLWREIRAAAQSGAPLRGVFERMGQALGRKPNSVRNYYYMQLRDQAGDELRRAAPFETFTDEEVHQLLRLVLSARGKGQSVRACVMEMSGGDKSLMLRYQNKYRAILRKKPELIARVCQELAEEGLPHPTLPEPSIAAPAALESRARLPQTQDADIQAALDALERLAQRLNTDALSRGDRLRVQRDLLLMRLEDLQIAARDLVAACKDFLGTPPDDRAALLPAFCDTLTVGITRLENLAG